MNQPRPTWDEYYLSIAERVATRSPDTKRQVGCVLVNPDRHIIGTGYNGTPPSYDDSGIDWQGDDKHSVVIHAEANALLHTNGLQVKGSTLYCTDSPCVECVKLLASAGIVRVVFSKVYKHDALALMERFGIEYAGSDCAFVRFRDFTLTRRTAHEAGTGGAR